MPTFSYKCQHCEQVFELNLRIGENNSPTEEPCPYCHQVKVSQIITYTNPLADPYALGRHHLSGEWKDFLKKIKDKNPGSNINI